MEMPAVADLIPQREPFLFLDRIIEIDARRIHAAKQVTGREDFFRGHYPAYPLMPGVLLCEAILQAGAALIAWKMQQAGKCAAEILPVVTRLQDAKFNRQVRPGDLLTITAEINEQLANAYYCKGEIRVGEDVALRLQFTVAGVKPT